jgi:predicted nucleic acid-binding protein
MKLVVDASVVFAALAGKGAAKEIFFSEKVELLSPQRLFMEIEEHLSEIEDLAGFSGSELRLLLDKVTVTTFPLSAYEQHLFAANSLIPDKEDTEYLALSMALDNCPIWSNDAHFKKQSVVKVYTTTELVWHLKSEGKL